MPPQTTEESSAAPVSFAQRAISVRFQGLYAEGMGLVEEVASYLDGPGRLEAKALPRSMAAAYAAESMRLTTRLMQIASWLLVQKAIFEGDLDKAQGCLERNRVELTTRGLASQVAVFAELPEALQELAARSMRIQARILKFEGQLKPPARSPVIPFGLGIKGQFDLLRRAFAPGTGPR